jgi:hypothetical protein
MTNLTYFCQEPRSMQELLDEGFQSHTVYNAVRRGDLKNINAIDAWGRRTYGLGSFVATVQRRVKYDASSLISAWGASL